MIIMTSIQGEPHHWWLLDTISKDEFQVRYCFEVKRKSESIKYIIVQIAMNEENLYLYLKVAFIWSPSPEILPINALIFTWADDDLRFCDKLNWIQTLKVHTDQNHWTKTTD